MTPSRDADFELQIKNFRTLDVDLESVLHRYFESLLESGEIWDWPAVAEYGRQSWELAFGEHIERRSPIDSVISAVAGAGYEAAIRHVARRLGVPARAIHAALNIDPNEPPAAIDADAAKFVAECQSEASKGSQS